MFVGKVEQLAIPQMLLPRAILAKPSIPQLVPQEF